MSLSNQFASIFVIALIAISSNATAAKFYKWTDDAGNTHYSDSAPENDESKAEAVHVTTSKPSHTEHKIPAFETESESETEEKEADPEMMEFCEKTAKNVEVISKGGPIKAIDEEGNTKLLSPEEMDAKLEKYQTQLDKNCANY